MPGAGSALHRITKLRVTPEHAEAAGSPAALTTTRDGVPSGPQLLVLGLLIVALIAVVVL